jgi:DNA polymerase III subunit gamma/tau
MASQSLYRKWRSQTFGDLVGQEAIVRTLKNALSSGKIAHAYLFAGPRGTGKTSTARLLAKTINCANPVDGEPCNTCQQCREITAGNSFNVIEIDAASNRGIDNIRDLREKIMMPPSTGRYKVYVLDEAHMLTTEAFNALLKTLEEPPSYAIFVMATTDVHKMLPTVLSRCQRFDFKRITTRQIAGHLLFVAQEEDVLLERPAAELIARAAAGGMRDALSLLDQAIAYAGSQISLAQVQAMLGIADPLALVKLLTQIARLDSATALRLLHEFAENGADLRQVHIQVGEYWRALMLARAGADIDTILDRTEDETREIARLAPLFELEELIEFARIFAQNDLLQKNLVTPQLGLELACLQCIELHRRGLASSLTLTRQPATADLAANTHDASEPAGSAVAVPGRVEAAMPGVTPPATEPAAGEESRPALTLQQVRDAWDRVKKRVRGRQSTGIKAAAFLNDYTVVAVEGSADATIVVIQAAHQFHFLKLQENSEYCADVEWALKLEFDVPCRLRLLPPGPLPPPPGQLLAPAARPAPPQQPDARQEKPLGQGAPPVSEKGRAPVAKSRVERENISGEAAHLSLETIKQKASGDPVVQEVVRTFGASIVDVRLK